MISSMEDVFDYIIIGSGFGGSVSALRLSEKGYSVALIEQGKRFGPEDFAKTNWNLRKYLWLPSLGFYGIQKLSFFRQASILTGTGLGGGSLVYANTLFKPPAKFFNSGSWSRFGDWQKTLEPFYETAGFMMGRTLYDQQNQEDLLLRKVAKSMNRESSFQNVYVAVNLEKGTENTDPYFSGHGPKRNPCTSCAGCMVGCRENAKNTLDKNYLYFAEKFGAGILTETRAVKLEFQEGIYSLHTSSIYSLQKSSRVLKGKNIIISAGTLGTLKFLFRQKYKYKTLPLLSDSLGSNLLTNSETLTAVSGIREKMNNGVAISSVFHPDDDTHIEIVKYPDGSNLMKFFFTLAAGGAKNNFRRSLKLIGNMLRHPFRLFKTLFYPGWSGNTVIFLVMQTLDNAMKMRWKKGVLGGSLKIDNRGNKRVPAYIEIGQKVTESFAAETGGISQNIILEVVLDRPTTAHILGGCPMSDNAAEGVVNPKLEVHSYPGMYIIDGSIIQNNPGVNPSYSILAMAEYAMSMIPEVQGNKADTLKKLMEDKKQSVS
ncbi:MAG: GMC family oxidoreductase [Bacteroidales bacterium]|nr:GMC family oxidoreductase [Bacteroidales bacterium]